MNTLNNVLGIPAPKITYTIDVSHLYPSLHAESIMSDSNYTEIKFSRVLMTQFAQSKFTIIHDDIKLLSSVSDVILEHDDFHKVSASLYYLKNGDICFYLKPKYKQLYATFIHKQQHVAKSFVLPENVFTLQDTPLNTITPILKHRGHGLFTDTLTIGSTSKGTNALNLSGSFNLNDIVHSTDQANLYLDANKTHIRNLDISNTLVVNSNTEIKGDLKLDGNLIYEGDAIQVETETLNVENNYIILNANIETINTAFESGIIINRAKENNIHQEPFKIIYNDDRSRQGDYIEVGISGNLMRVPTTNADENTATGLIPVWNSNGFFNVKTSPLSVDNTTLNVNRDIRLTGTIYDKNGTPIQGGVGGDGINKSAIDPTISVNGDLYYNTSQNIYKYYNSSWISTEIGQIFQQPPPLINLTNTDTFTHFDIEWTLPPQFATSITSDINFSSEHSPAVMLHPITNRNMVYFPIVNRICIKIYEYDSDVCGNYVSYPLYNSANQSITSSVSQVDPSGNVIYRKGDIVAGQQGASITGYTSVAQNHFIKNMPNKIRFYRKLPSAIPTNLPKTIMPFNNPIFEMPLSRYWIEIWMENNSLEKVNKQIVIGQFKIANPPSSPETLNITFADTLSNNNFPRFQLQLKDPLNIDAQDPALNNILNIDKIIYEWSADNVTWYPFTRLLGNQYINLTNGIETNNRPIDNINTRTYRFDLNVADMGDALTAELEKLHAAEVSTLYVSVRFKNISNNAFTPRGPSNITTINFDIPSAPKSVTVAFIDSPNTMNGALHIIDPDFVLGNTNPTLQFSHILFEWGIDDVWNVFNRINSVGILNGELQINRARVPTQNTYTFTFNSVFLNNWSDLNTPTNVKIRVSYRNKSKPLYGEITETSILFEAPSIPQKNILSFSLTTDLRESRCNLEVQNPANILSNQPLYNDIARYTGIQFQWGISAEEIEWNNFVNIIDVDNKALVSGVYAISPVTTVNKSYQFDISSTYLGVNTINDDLSKNLVVRIRFRNNVIFGSNAFSPWLNSNDLYFDRPSKPRKNEIDYSSTLSTGITRVNQIVIDPSFVLGEDDTTNTKMNFTGIKFFWKSDKMEEWEPFIRIRDTSDEISLTNGEYTINNAFSDSPFTYTFDICSTYLGPDATSLIEDGSKNVSVYIQYRNSAISAYSDLLESNVILLEPPAQPPSVDLSFLRTEIPDFDNPITECSIIIEEPNVMRTQNYNTLSFTGVHLQWKKDTEWYDLSGVRYNNSLITLSDGVHSLVRPKQDTVFYSFVVNNTYLGNDFVPMNSGDTLEVRARYRNSVLSEFSEFQESNELLFEQPSEPILVDLSYVETLDISNTRYAIHITKMNNMLASDDTNNSKIRLSGVGLEWGISAEEMVWYNFKNIATIIGDPSDRMVSGVYLTNASYTAVTPVFYFDTTDIYLDVSVNEVLQDTEKKLVVRARYRNTTVPEFSEYVTSNDLIVNRPSDTRELTWNFFSSTDVTQSILNIKVPEFTVSGEILGNDRIDLTGIRFEWKYENDTTWNNMLKINIEELTDGILDIRYKNTITNVSYLFDISREYMGDYVLYDGSSVDVRVSYRNSTIGNELSEGYNEPIIDTLLFEVPTEPVNVRLDFNSTIGEYNTPITVCEIGVIDPSKTLKTENNPLVNLKDMLFQWTLDGEWNNIIKIKVGDVSYNVPYEINRARDGEERVYMFELNAAYMENFVQPEDGDNLKVRVAYCNTILPDLYGEVTESNELLFKKPSAVRSNELFFNMTIDVFNTECYIQLEHPEYSSLPNRNVLNYTGIDLKWGISGEDIEFYPFTNIAVQRNLETSKLIKTDCVEDGVYLINALSPASVLYFETTAEYMGENITKLITDSEKELIVNARYRNSAVPDWSDDLSSNPIVFNKPSVIPNILLNIERITDIYTTECKIEIQKPSEFIDTFDYGVASIRMTRLKLQWKYDGVWRDFTGIKRNSNTDISGLENGIYSILPIRDTEDFETYYFDICSNCLGENPFPIVTTENIQFSVRAQYSNSVNTEFSGETTTSITFGKSQTPTISDVVMVTPKTIKISIEPLPVQDIINGFGTPVSVNSGIFIQRILLKPRYTLDDQEEVIVNDIDLLYNNGAFDISYSLPEDVEANNLYNIKFTLQAKNNLIDVWSDAKEDEGAIQITKPETTGQTINSISVTSDSRLNLNWNHPTIRGASTAVVGVPLISKYSINADGVTGETNMEYDYDIDVGTDAANTINTMDVFGLINGKTGPQFINVSISQRNPYVKATTSITGAMPFEVTELGKPTIEFTSDISAIVNKIELSWDPPSDTGFKIGELDGTEANIPVRVDITYTVTVALTNSFSPYYKTLSISPSFFSVGNLTETTLGVLTNEYNSILVYPETTYTVDIDVTNIYGGSNTNSAELTTPVPPLPARLTYISVFPLAPVTDIRLPINKYQFDCFILNEEPNTTTTFDLIRVNRPTDLSYNSPSITHIMNKVKLNSWVEEVNINDISDIKARRFEIRNDADNTVVYSLGTDTNLYNIDTGPLGILTLNNASNDAYIEDNSLNLGYWWKEDISYSLDFSKKTDELYGKPIKLSIGIKYNNSTTEDYDGFTFDAVEYDASNVILQDTINTTGFAYFDDLSLNPVFKDKTDVSNITDVENVNAINGIPNIYPIGVVSEVDYETKYKLNHYLTNYSKYFGMSGEIINYELVKDGSLFYENKLLSLSWKNKPAGMKRLEREWELSGVIIEIPEISKTTTTGIQIRANYRNQRNTSYTSHIMPRLFIYDKVSVERLRTLKIESNATISTGNFTLPTGIGELIQVPIDFDPTDPLGETQSNVFSENPYTDFSQYNSRQLLFYNGSFRTYENMKSFIDVTDENVRKQYNINGTFDAEYSYVIFKFTRNNLNSKTANQNIPYKFVMSFNDQTNISYDDLTSGNVKVFVLVKSIINNETETETETVYRTNTGDYTSTSNTITYRWILYKPNTNSSSASVQNLNTTVVSISEGLGSNNDTTDRFTNNNSGIGSFPNATQTYYSTSIRNLSGVFYAEENFANGLSLSFYVAIRIKNTLDRYINNITSFDVIDITGNIGRP